MTRSQPTSIPNLVTACNNTLTIYRVTKDGKLAVEYNFGKLSGSVIHLSTLESSSGKDGLLVGFAGESKLSVLSVTDHGHLQAESLVDFTSTVEGYAYGSTQYQDEDMQIVSLEMRPGVMNVVACIIGGGIAVAVLEVEFLHSRWMVRREPYFLPLSSLSAMLPNIMSAASSRLNPQQLSTGFGDIVSHAFLSGYLEPVLVLLHSQPGGRNWMGRVGREHGKGGADPLFVSAVSISVSHGRSAVLWSIAVSADSDRVMGYGQTDCLVIGPNTLTFVESGRVSQIIAVNGWARATCPSSLQKKIGPNPLIKLAVQLDGSSIVWIAPHSAVISLRRGQLYILQRLVGVWTLLPLGRTLEAVGEVSHLHSLPLSGPSGFLEAKDRHEVTEYGLLFCGSRLGDSLFLGYSFEDRALSSEARTFEKLIKQEEALASVKPEIKVEEYIVQNPSQSKDLEDMILQEEEALYAPEDSLGVDVVPLSDDEEVHKEEFAKRQRLNSYSILKSLVTLDSIKNVGPLGRACLGPVAPTPEFILKHDKRVVQVSNTLPPMSDPAHIFPCGYGSSGGLAIFTVPGRDDRTILVEEDCVNVENAFYLGNMGLLVLALSSKMDTNTKILQVVESDEHNGICLKEILVKDVCGEHRGDESVFASAADIFNSRVLSAFDVDEDCFGLVVSISGFDVPQFCFALFKKVLGGVKVLSQKILHEGDEDTSLNYISPAQKCTTGSESRAKTWVCGLVWSSGDASVLFFSQNGEVRVESIPKVSFSETMEIEESKELDHEEMDVRDFYKKSSVLAIDVFEARDFFSKLDDGTPSSRAEIVFNDEDLDENLYEKRQKPNKQVPGTTAAGSRQLQSTPLSTFVSVSRQSSSLEVYKICPKSIQLVWRSMGCGLGCDVLKAENSEELIYPRFHKVSATEIRFFECGLSVNSIEEAFGSSLCLGVKLDNGDFYLYRCNTNRRLSFERVPLGTVAREGDEAKRHRMKLIRRKILSKDAVSTDTFKPISLHRFDRISGRKGLFASLSRPHWVIGENGVPSVLYHRMRHSSPAGATDSPIVGFCPGILGQQGNSTGFLSIHARVGRVGSQRITVFEGLGTGVERSSSTISAGSLVERKLLGVTVRAIEFINDALFSTASAPLYAVLVSKEIENDQRSLNTDEMTEEERLEIEEKKEAALIKRQVEADLGGYEMDNEFVEEIGRENCFAVDQELGGAPPAPGEKYSLWIVNGADDFKVLDSFDLEENEFGLCLSIMELSEFKEEPGRNAEEAAFEQDLYNRFFITVGTGVVENDGEDVGSKGRALLFELQRPADDSFSHVELSLTYEKLIFHGPISSMVCVSNEGRNRLIIAAGADGKHISRDDCF